MKTLKILGCVAVLALAAGPVFADAYSFGFGYSSGGGHHRHHGGYPNRWSFGYSWCAPSYYYCPPPVVYRYYEPPAYYYSAPPPPVYYYEGGNFYRR